MAREKVLAAKAANRNLVGLAGDSHNAFASDLRDASGQAVGVEYAKPSVRSTGLEVKYGTSAASSWPIRWCASCRT